MIELEENHSFKTARSWKRVVLRAALFLCLSLFLVCVWLANYAYRSIPDPDSRFAVVYIPKGASVKKIAEILDDSELIENDVRFLLLSRLTGKGNRLKAGEFRLETGHNPLEILDMLVRATPIQHKVTIPEGLQAAEIAEIFDREGWCDSRGYENLIKDKTFIASLGLDGLSSLEGYLFPDTYFLTRDIQGAEKIIRMQVKRFQAVWKSLLDDVKESVDREETVILASIVEKETGDPAERPLIAGVFLNRLKTGMRLQSDPTVIYGVATSAGKITRQQLKARTPYNTYVIPGLPAGPIANPGKEAIHAVLFPADTKYLYFVSKNDGTHHFSKNLKEHNRAVRKYQRKKKHKNGNDKE